MAICPYFGQEKNYCDVGEEYISPYDVVAMSHFCSCRYRECEKFQELAERHPEVLEPEQRPQPTVDVAAKSDDAIVPHSQIAHQPITINFRNKWPLSQRLSSVLAQL